MVVYDKNQANLDSVEHFDLDSAIIPFVDAHDSLVEDVFLEQVDTFIQGGKN